MLHDLLDRDHGIDVVVCDVGAAPSGVSRGVGAIRRRLLEALPGAARPTAVLTGDVWLQHALVRALTLSGLRGQITLVSHVRAREVPLGPPAVRLCSTADLVVVESSFGARAVTHACQVAAVRLRRPAVVIPPAIPPQRSPIGSARSLQPEPGRQRVDSEALLVATPAADASDPSAFQALGIFRAFARGLYWICDECRRISPFETDDELQPRPRTTCAGCGAAHGRAGQPWHGARLMVCGHLPAASLADRPWFDWTLQEAQGALGLGGHVVFSAESTCGGADILLVPHGFADVPVDVLAGCAAGIPTVTTRFGAAEELPTDAVHLVQPRALQFEPEGYWTAAMDVGGSIQALLELAGRPDARRTRGHAAERWSRQHAPDVTRAAWRATLASLRS